MMATISELNRSTEEKLDLAREKLKDLNERIFGSEKNRDSSSQQRRRSNYDLKRTLSSNSSNNRVKSETHDEDDEQTPKVPSRVISKDTAITKREQVIAMQSRQNDLERNKRMFGCLLGTLQKFRKEENFLKSKEEKKAKIESKIEEQEQLEKIKLKEERDALIANRKKKQLEVKILETKMNKLKDFSVAEESQRNLINFIKTSTKPSIYWLPKIMTPKASQLQSKTKQEMNDLIEERRKQIDEEMKEIEDQIVECESGDDDDKKLNSHNNAAIVDSQNGREKDDNNDKGIKRRATSKSYSPEIKKRICSQVVVKNKE